MQIVAENTFVAVNHTDFRCTLQTIIYSSFCRCVICLFIRTVGFVRSEFRESGGEDDVAEELRAHSGDSAAGDMAADHRDRATSVHSRGPSAQNCSRKDELITR